MTTLNKILLIVVLLLAAVVVLYAAKVTNNLPFIENFGDKTTQNSQDTDEQLGVAKGTADLYNQTEESPFAAAENLLRNGPDGYEAARRFYEIALEEATSVEQRAHIEYKIALTYTNIDNHKVIELMQDIARNSTYPELQRAYAVQYLFVLYAIKAHDPTLLEKIFSGDQFSDLWDEESLDISMRNLAQFGLQFDYVPHLSLVEAQTYAVELIEGDEEIPPEDFDSFVNRIEPAIALALDHMDQISGGANSDQIPKILSRTAIVTGYLNVAGVEGYDEKYIDALERFYSMTDYYDVRDWQPDFIDQGSAYNLAYLAARAENSRAFQINKTYLDTVIQNPDQFTGVRTTIEKQKDGAFSGKTRPSYLAAYYAPFKAYLLENGWSEADILPVQLGSTYAPSSE